MALTDTYFNKLKGLLSDTRKGIVENKDLKCFLESLQINDDSLKAEEEHKKNRMFLKKDVIFEKNPPLYMPPLLVNMNKYINEVNMASLEQKIELMPLLRGVLEAINNRTQQFASDSNLLKDRFLNSLIEINERLQGLWGTSPLKDMVEEIHEKNPQKEEPSKQKKPEEQLLKKELKERNLPEKQLLNEALEEEYPPQSEEQQYQNCSKKRIAEIAQTLTLLRSKIGEINQHHFLGAYKTAQELLANLETAQNKYKDALLKEGLDIKVAEKQFNDACETAIIKAKPVLERDLGWKDYLVNLLKTLANALIWTATIGHASAFFPYKESKSSETVKQAEQALKQKL